MSSLADRVRLLSSFIEARHGVHFRSRAALEAHQERRLRRFFRRTLPRSPYFRDLAGKPFVSLPVMSKRLMLEHFSAINTRGIDREHAFAVALEAEATRDFRPLIDDVSVGLSTGTSGQRGLFLASAAERMRWAGIMLGRMLPGRLTDRHRIAFLLRANNALYESVSGRLRIEFRFLDLKHPIEDHIHTLRDYQPTVLIAPAQVLRLIAQHESAARAAGAAAQLEPGRIISVAEVLFDDDRAAIERTFGRRVDQIYQCTEGFLGYTCSAGRLHINEAFLHIEPEWLDTGKTRFQPIVTDFNRTTQPIVRFRLDDVLTIDPEPCRCGSHERIVARIEGRADDILVLARKVDGTPVHLMPDFVVRALAGLASPEGPIDDFQVSQIEPNRLLVLLATPRSEAARADAGEALHDLFDASGLVAPALTFGDLARADLTAKRRRVRRHAEIPL